MPFHTFGPALVRDHRGPLTGRGVRVLSWETQQQIETYSTGADPQVQPVVTDSDGYVPEFKTQAEERVVWLDIDGRRVPLIAYEVLSQQVLDLDNAEQILLRAQSAADLVEQLDATGFVGPQGGLTPEEEERLATAVSGAEAAAAEVENATRVTTRFRPGDEAEFRVVDLGNRFAWGVGPRGETIVGTMQMIEREDGWRLADRFGAVAIEVDENGRTHIYDLATGGGQAQVTELHAFIAAGQSNMSGRGLPIAGSHEIEDPRVLQYGSKDRTLRPATVPLDMHDAASGLSPASVFAWEYLAHQPAHVGVLLIPAAHGGTTFTTGTTSGLTWTKGHGSDPTKALYELSVTQTQQALAAAETEGYAVSLKAVLWHQGEGNGGMTEAQYAGYLDQLIVDYRADLEAPDLPFVIGQMAPEGTAAYTTRKPVDRAHLQTPARLHHVGFAPSQRDMVNHDDVTHFSRDGAAALGAEYLRGYHQALANIPTGEPLKPHGVTATRTGTEVLVEWRAPLCRVTGYVLEYSVDGGSWNTATRAWATDLRETLTGITGGSVRVRVSSAEDAVSSNPTRPVTATGA